MTLGSPASIARDSRTDEHRAVLARYIHRAVTHPFERIPHAARKPVMISLLIATLIATAVLSAIGDALRTEATPLGVISFELCAWNASCEAALSAYRAVPFEVGLSIGFDYLYLVLYPSALAAALVFLARRRSDRIRSLAAILAWGAFAAAALDAVENAAMYRMLATQHASAPAAWLSALAATAKFALVIFAILGLPVVAVARKRT